MFSRLLRLLLNFIDWPTKQHTRAKALPVIPRPIKADADKKQPLTVRARASIQSIILPLLILSVVVTGQLLLFWLPKTGVYFNQCALTLLLIIGLCSRSMRQLSLTAAILPAVNAGVILFNQQADLAQTVILYEFLLVMTLIYRYIIRSYLVVSRPLRALKYRYIVPLILIAGLLLGLIEAAVFGFGYSITSDLVAPFIGLIVLAAISEEVYFRALLQTVAQKVMPPVQAVVLTACIYAVYGAHITNIWFVLFSLLSSCIISIVFYYKRNLTLSVALNLTIKLTIIAIVGRHVI